MTAQHAAGRRWWIEILDGVLALWAGIMLRIAWWDWPVAQWYWHRQYKRADRRAFAAEMAALDVRPGPDTLPLRATPPAQGQHPYADWPAYDGILDDVPIVRPYVVMAPADWINSGLLRSVR